MWKVSWLYEKVHNFWVVPLYYYTVFIFLVPAPSVLNTPSHQTLMHTDMTKTRNGLGKRTSKRTGKNLPEKRFLAIKFTV